MAAVKFKITVTERKIIKFKPPFICWFHFGKFANNLNDLVSSFRVIVINAYTYVLT